MKLLRQLNDSDSGEKVKFFAKSDYINTDQQDFTKTITVKSK